MAKIQRVAETVSKSALRNSIATSLKKNFADLAETVGEKKFKKNIEKASKILASGVTKKRKQLAKKSTPKKTVTKKK
ncbi:MAG: hypothetical protein QM802_19530 [Agriterribacter sp.]